MTIPRIHLWAVFGLFAIEAVLTGLLFARFPDIKDAARLSNAEFGLALLGIPAGTVIGFLLAPWTIGRVGLTRVSWLAVAVLALATVGPSLAKGTLGLVFAFALFGLCLSHTEVTQNSLAGHLERVGGRRFMSRGHGAWSVGSITGLLLGGASSGAGISVAMQSGTAAILGLAVAILLARILPQVQPRPARTPPTKQPIRERIPPLALILICVLPLGTLAVEGIVRDWGAIFLRDVLGADPFAATLLFVVLSVSMAVIRLLGDALLERLGERMVVATSILCASIGLIIVALAQSVGIALVGAAIAGMGVAATYPVALSIAARRSETPERDVATVSFICFVALMASPTIVGFLSEAFGLRFAFAAFGLVSLLAIVLLPVTGRRR